MMWLGIVIFWAINLIVIMVTFFMRAGDAADWYKRVLFYGAFELAELVANRSDELRLAEGGSSMPSPCWKPVFIFWWAFSIKYFVPWALLSLMMWNFKIDIDLVDYRGYGGYHDMWQVVGFIYPLIGLLCFLIPICIVTTPEDKLAIKDENDQVIGRKEVNLDYEEDPVHRQAELEYLKGLQAARDALLKMNDLKNKKNDEVSLTKN